MKNYMKEIEKLKENPRITALPHELIVEILLRLPVRSLLRFKCVCKKWLSTISDPQFCKSHYDLAAAPTHRLLNLPEGIADVVESFDVDASLNDDSAVVNLKFPPYTAPFFQTIGSCRGFVLLTKMMHPTGDLILWNPSTAAHREIPATYADWNSWYDPSTRFRQGIPPYFAHFMFQFLYGFGYDQLKDEYLLVLIRLENRPEPQVIHCSSNSFMVSVRYGGPVVKSSRPRIEVLSLNTNVPSFYYDDVEYLDLGYESNCGIFLDKSLHWLVKSKATQLHVVLAFDLVDRSLLEIPLSPDLAAELAIYKNGYLRVLGGCLSVGYSSGGDGPEVAEIWVMKDYKVQSSWTKSFVLTFLDLVDGVHFFPMFFTRGGGIFGADENGTHWKFSDDGKKLENYSSGQEGALRVCDMYRESILTLPELALPDDFEEENEDA
ncbi:F-box/kelch-repeat protein At3g23880-like [Lotus japonicus]|uniref:F-box/kelch-repeat protein At3g23880-like n=1 Tax=Lotus japonicus TaxID=34305 RepID=UPI00258FA190|nr:F-box/kelch-repeat protein At3g23880-like [Lotus japonicus]XP_057436191.1 F-box/kelch-repeat protein At3g23880-like [Lotus japonicus]XP_057436192.1 F-box/kelch-repeat protein At3g23880-like [Lotus japonicus]